MSEVYAGIVSYNPDISRLKNNIESILPQVKKIYVVDNGSDNYEDIVGVCDVWGVSIIRNRENYGIAKALNQIFEMVMNLHGGVLMF